MQNYFKYIKDYFNLNRSEQRGLIILFCLLLVIILSIFLLPYFITDKPVDFTDFEEKVAAFEKQQKYLSDSIQEQKDKYSSKNNQTQGNQLNPFPFDPNNLSVVKWKKLGLSDQQVKVIKNYESKGGRFYKASDLAKIYSISKEEFIILEPYIKIHIDSSRADEIDKTPELLPFPFDPNTLSADGFAEMGLNEKASNSIINYRNSGGVFKTKEDLKKIYNLPKEDYVALEPFIQLPDHIEITTTEIAAPPLQIEINQADTLDLQQIAGIGPSFARRIVKYRNMLGGYYKVEQLMEVYGMDSLLYSQISKHLVFDQNSLKKINISKATIKELIKHPYIEFYLAKSIITFREKEGQIKSLEEIRNVRLMYDELFNKISPYIAVNEE